MCISYQTQSSAQREIEDSIQVFSDLIRAVQKVQAELVLDIEEKQRKTESWANGHIQELEQEIDVLKLRNTELEYLSQTEDHIHFLQVKHFYPTFLCNLQFTNVKSFHCQFC